MGHHQWKGSGVIINAKELGLSLIERIMGYHPCNDSWVIIIEMMMGYQQWKRSGVISNGQDWLSFERLIGDHYQWKRSCVIIYGKS